MTTGAKSTPTPQRWRNEVPGRGERTTEADAHESGVERLSRPGSHHCRFNSVYVNLVPQPPTCEVCGAPAPTPADLAPTVRRGSYADFAAEFPEVAP